jgi:hypothetical protein
LGRTSQLCSTLRFPICAGSFTPTVRDAHQYNRICTLEHLFEKLSPSV